MSQWKPGDVALVRPIYCDHPDVVAVRTGVPPNMGWSYSMQAADGTSTRTWASDPDGLSAIRPLVVIDPEDREQAERLTTEYVKTWLGPRETTSPESIDQMQAALREFANPTPPKPKEPIGLGAVVEAANGDRWVRVEALGDPDHIHVWVCEADDEVNPRRWEDVYAVKVLSEGVTP